MPYVSLFVYSDGTKTENHPQPEMHIINPKIIFTPMFIPGQYSFDVTVGIMELDTEKEEHTARYTFSGPDGGIIINSGGIRLQKTEQPQKNLPPDMRGGIISLDFRNVILNKNGTYKSEVFCDGESLGDFPISVRGINTPEDE